MNGKHLLNLGRDPDFRKEHCTAYPRERDSTFEHIEKVKRPLPGPANI